MVTSLAIIAVGREIRQAPPDRLTQTVNIEVSARPLVTICHEGRLPTYKMRCFEDVVTLESPWGRKTQRANWSLRKRYAQEFHDLGSVGCPVTYNSAARGTHWVAQIQVIRQITAQAGCFSPGQDEQAARQGRDPRNLHVIFKRSEED